MKNLKMGDLCEIIDIQEGDGFFKHKDIVIGKKVKFIRFLSASHLEKHKKGFISCEVQIVDEFTIGFDTHVDKYVEGFTLLFVHVRLKKI
jgi:hypothetical protein